MRLLLGALIASCAITPANAQSSSAGRPLQTCVLPDTGAMDPAALIRTPARFDCTTEQHALGAGNFWIVSEEFGALPSSGGGYRIRMASLWQQGVTLYTLYADGTMRSVATDGRGVAPFVQLGAVVEMPVPEANVPPVRVMWHVRGSANLRGIVIGPRLATAEQSEHTNLALAALYAGFAGLCIALIMYNLALWGALRHRFQLYYCFMATMLLAYTFSSSGALCWTFPDVANNDRLRINYLVLGITGAAALAFGKSFFEERVFRGWLGHYTKFVAVLIAAMGLIFFVTAPYSVKPADTMFTIVFLALATVVAPTLWRAWRVRSNYLWLFAIGWGAPILAAVLRTLSALNFVPWSFWLDNSTILSMAVETVMSAFAIAYRIRLLRDERDDAIASEVMARRLADTDPLTGLLNRRAFLERAIGRSGEQRLLIADLDHFKRVNETLGHDGGDEVLRVFARMMRTAVPTNGLVARMGGEEFAILTDADSPLEPDALLARLRATRMPFDLQVTASIGACRGPLTSELEWKALYRGADIALFEAKSAGRDRVREMIREAA